MSLTNEKELANLEKNFLLFTETYFPLYLQEWKIVNESTKKIIFEDMLYSWKSKINITSFCATGFENFIWASSHNNSYNSYLINYAPSFDKCAVSKYEEYWERFPLKELYEQKTLLEFARDFPTQMTLCMIYVSFNKNLYFDRDFKCIDVAFPKNLKAEDVPFRISLKDYSLFVESYFIKEPLKNLKVSAKPYGNFKIQVSLTTILNSSLGIFDFSRKEMAFIIPFSKYLDENYIPLLLEKAMKTASCEPKENFTSNAFSVSWKKSFEI